MFYNQGGVVRFESYSNKKYFSPNNSTSGDKNIVEFNNSNTNDSKFLNENISNLNSSSGKKSSKNSSTPGFGLLGGLICLFGGWKLKKK